MVIDRMPSPPMSPANDSTIAETTGSFPAATLLTVLETSLNETIADFGEVSGRISERVLQHRLTSDLELIVSLQALDRLQQELVAYAGIVNHCASRLASPLEDETAADPIDAITLADLRKRLYDRCRNEVAMVSEAPGSISF